jgi:RNA polymerase sigma-70 factor (sigma-E family)
MRATVTADDPITSKLEDAYARHAPAALRLAYFLSGNPETARDLVQDAFVRVAGRFRYLRHPDAFDAYLRRTIVNLHTSRVRRLILERSSLAKESAFRVEVAVEEGHEARDEMWQAVLGLSPRQRAAIVLRYYEDLSERQAAEVMHCSVGALNQLVARAMANLRSRIEEQA